VVQADLGKKQEPIFKITRVKGAGSMTQLVKHLPSKHKALSKNPSFTRKKEKKKKRKKET
jgi:hypothetical protein